MIPFWLDNGKLDQENTTPVDVIEDATRFEGAEEGTMEKIKAIYNNNDDNDQTSVHIFE